MKRVLCVSVAVALLALLALAQFRDVVPLSPAGIDAKAKGGNWLFGTSCVPCDMNCDDDINSFDIEPFLDLLFDPKAKPCDTCTGDVDGNGDINAFDIEPFLECLFP